MANEQKLKEEYLKKYKRRIYVNRDKNVPTYAQWKKRRKTKGSTQTKKGVSSLSSGDYKELMKHFGK